MKNLIEINKGSIGTECLELIKNASKINELAKKISTFIVKFH